MFIPELPEVETVRRGLDAALSGAVIKSVQLRRKDLRIAFPENFAQALTGQTISHVQRRAKYLLFYLGFGDVVIAHLGMSGRFLVNSSKPASFSKHDHLVMILGDGRCLIFNDARRFGLMTLSTSETLGQHPLFAQLGPEPLSKDFSPSYLKKTLKTRKSAIKPAIMDQHVVVGVGNIYASEALFDAGINPEAPAQKATDKAEKLHKAIQKVLLSAIESGGSSLRDFMNIGGETGYFQHRFSVYGREGEPCPKCSTPIKQIRQAGRSTFFCPKCQK